MRAHQDQKCGHEIALVKDLLVWIAGDPHATDAKIGARRAAVLKPGALVGDRPGGKAILEITSFNGACSWH
jgi:hypothetical protein